MSKRTNTKSATTIQKNTINADYVTKPFEELQFYDAFMFGEIMQDIAICKKVLECILGKKILSLDRVVKEDQQQHAPSYRGIRLDVSAVDADGCHYNIEMQVLDKKDLPRRSRYYQGTLDTKSLAPGVTNYNALNDVYIIFICRFDPFHLGAMQYTFSECCKEYPDLELNDGAQRIFLNTTWEPKEEEDTAPTELSDFLHYIEHPVDYKYQYPLAHNIDQKVNLLKRNQKVREGYMTYAEIIADAVQEEKLRTEAVEVQFEIARKRADAEQERADTEQQRADAEQERADAEQQRADAEQERADAEQQRADAEQERADTEQQRADAEQQRADAERQRADQAEAHADAINRLNAFLMREGRQEDLLRSITDIEYQNLLIRTLL